MNLSNYLEGDESSSSFEDAVKNEEIYEDQSGMDLKGRDLEGDGGFLHRKTSREKREAIKQNRGSGVKVQKFEPILAEVDSTDSEQDF